MGLAKVRVAYLHFLVPKQLQRTAHNMKWVLRRGEYTFMKGNNYFLYKNVLILSFWLNRWKMKNGVY